MRTVKKIVSFNKERLTSDQSILARISNSLLYSLITFWAGKIIYEHVTMLIGNVIETKLAVAGIIIGTILLILSILMLIKHIKVLVFIFKKKRRS
ncbi:MAG: hypothetical protein IJC41_00235 [Firmicutes bacterium]|nr:hypothetical protein [Bacillota bacterium]